MRILIVNIYFHPDPTGTGLVITELARDLVACGHNVTVITTVPHYGRTPGEEAWQDCDKSGGCDRARGRRHSRGGSILLRHLWTETELDGIRVIRTAVYIPRRKTFLNRVINYASFSLLAILGGLKCGAQDLILCTSPPLSIGVSAWILARLKGVPFVFNVQDIYPDAAVLMGMIRNRWLIAFFQRLERFIYRRAALVTVISEGAKRNLLPKGVAARKIAVIPNWVDVEHVRPVPVDNQFRHGLGLGESRIVMFAGNIGLIAGLESVLEAAAALSHRSDIHFLIVGEGNAKAGLLARAREMALNNVSFLPTQPREILPQVLGSADVHLVTLKRQMSTTSVPSKAYGIMASGRAMVAAVDPDSEIWRLVQESDAGLCVLPEEPEALARAIEALCDDPDRRRRMGESARAYVTRHNAEHELTRLYEQTLLEVAQGTSHEAVADRQLAGTEIRRDPGPGPTEMEEPFSPTGAASLEAVRIARRGKI